MSSNWLDLLKASKGRSEYVIAINIDIRGFTPFSLSVESIDLGQYIKTIYLEILSKYFPEAVYSKPMGDGLFIIYNYEETSVKDTVNMIVEKCIELEKNFNTLLKDDPMIVFETPAKIGIGITRGTTCCIHNGEHIIDYSGKILNHAARLVEKARPSGVICDYISFYNILNEDLSKLFEEETACLRGVSEIEPIKILVQKKRVQITDRDKRPLNEVVWEIIKESVTIGFIKSMTQPWFKLDLDKKPLNKNEIILELSYQRYNDGEKVDRLFFYDPYDFTSKNIRYHTRGPRQYILFNFDILLQQIEDDMMPDNEEINIEITYPI